MKNTDNSIVLPVHQTSETVRKAERYQIDDFKKMIRSMNLKITDQRLLILS